MPWPFRGKLSGDDRRTAVSTIRHLQLQGALMQLATETYNGALFIASTTIEPGDGLTTRTMVGVSDPGAAVEYLLPAVERKIGIGNMMLAEHQAFQSPDRPAKAFQAYKLWSGFLDIFLARTSLQFACWKDWVADPSVDLTPRMTALDQPENRALTASVTELNELIALSGISQDSWFSINCAAFNDVRSRIGLPPLTETDFRAKFFQGLAGATPRYFE
jgi:hypothetical protein